MSEIIALVNKMSPYLLLGFLLAGVMHAFVPSRLYRRYLGGSSFRSVVNAALLGVPLPLCSCGVIPTAMSLRKEGASKGAAVSFLIATPQTGVDSIFATYSLMGLPFALLRPVAALVTALFGGQVVNMFDKKDVAVAEEIEAQKEPALSFGGKIRKALKYAFVDMMQDIGRWLVVGLVVAGLITVFVPASFFALFADNSLLSMVVVLLFAMPMYLCATGSIPIAVALMLKGLSPGTALVLLMAGPAVNAASMLVVGKVMGRRSLMLYLLSIVGGAMAFGLAVDHLLPRYGGGCRSRTGMVQHCLLGCDGGAAGKCAHQKIQTEPRGRVRLRGVRRGATERADILRRGYALQPLSRECGEGVGGIGGRRVGRCGFADGTRRSAWSRNARAGARGCRGAGIQTKGELTLKPIKQ